MLWKLRQRRQACANGLCLAAAQAAPANVAPARPTTGREGGPNASERRGLLGDSVLSSTSDKVCYVN